MSLNYQIVEGNLSIIDHKLSTKTKNKKILQNNDEKELCEYFVAKKEIWKFTKDFMSEFEYDAIYLNPPWEQDNSLIKFVCIYYFIYTHAKRKKNLICKI